MKPESQWSESFLTLQLSIWFRAEYPNVPYRIDIAADMPLPPIHRGRLKVLHGKWSKGHPDMTIYVKGGGFFEIKTLSAGLPDTEHTRTQKAYHKELVDNGFKCWFCIGFEDCKKKIKKFMKGKTK